MMLLSGSASARCSAVQSKTGLRIPQTTAAGILSSSSSIGFLLQQRQGAFAVAFATSGSCPNVQSYPVDGQSAGVFGSFNFPHLTFHKGFSLRHCLLDAVRQGELGLNLDLSR